MTEVNTQALKKDFHHDIIELYKRITKIVKYKPTRLMDYINKYGGYEAAVKYITTESNVQDFAVLWEKEHLELSVEALITSEKYRDIFDENIVSYCDRKLKEYSYAPNKIEEVEEPSGYIDEAEEPEIDIEAFIKQKEQFLAKQAAKRDYKIYKFSVGISKEDWESILLNTKVVTTSNLDFLLRLYSIGDEVGPAELSKEKGFSATYPYKEVMMALGKRIKTALKTEVPAGEDGKPLWWHLLFNGGFKDNSHFEWSLKTALRQALDELVAKGQVIKPEVTSQKALVHITEEPFIPETASEAVPGAGKKEEMSAFDRLFASIMAEPEEKKTAAQPVSEVIKKTEPEVAVEKEEKQVSQKPEADRVQVPEAVLKEPAAEAAETEDQTQDYKTRIKKECIAYYGAICDLCGFDYGYTYGEAFEDLIEVHHIHQQGAEEISKDTDPVKDLIPVCSNCHKVIHSQNPPVPVEKMRKMIKA